MNSDNTLKNKFNFDNALIEFDKKNYTSVINNLTVYLQENINDSDALHLLAVSTALNGNHEGSLNYYREALKLCPNNPQILSNYASSLSKLGDNKSALIYQKKSIEFDPNNFEFFFNCGNIYCELKLYEESLNYYKKSIELNQSFPFSFNNLGKALFDLKLFKESLYYFDEALKLNPQFLDCLNNKGIALRELKKFDQSLACIQLALDIQSNNPQTLTNFGVVLCGLRKFEMAIDYFERAINIDPECIYAWSNKASTLIEQKKHGDALFCLDKTLSLDFYFEWVFGDFLFTKLKLGIWKDYYDDLNKLFGSITAKKKIAKPFICLALTSDPHIQQVCAEVYAQSIFSPQHRAESNKCLPVNKKIKLAYFSSDFGSHAVSSLIVELLELHDKNSFEIIAFSFAKNDGSELYSRIINSFDEFLELENYADRDVATLARQKGIDIAIDLGGYTGSNRVTPFSYGVAPIQVNYLGYPGTSGTSFMDYIIADPVLISPDQEIYYSEKVVYLPHTYQPNDRKKFICNKFISKSDVGLPDGEFIYCCFNNSFKVQPAIFNIWMNILRSVENSVLWLLKDDPIYEKNLCYEAALRGLNPNRLIFAERLPLSEHLGRHSFADLFLDTYPYNAHTTASDALWSGLPLLTLKGNSFASRVASSLLTSMNLTELICQSPDEYEKKAIHFANNPKTIQDLKTKIMQTRESSPLFNTPLMTRNIEIAYKKMHWRYINGLKPEKIYV